MQVVLVNLQPFCSNLVLKCALHPKIAKNSLKTFFWGVQGRSRSSMLLNPKSLSPVLVMISSMYVPICNRFHVIRANNGKMTSFYGGTPLWRPRSRGTPAPSGTKFCHDKLDFGAAHSEDFVILACTVLIQITSVTNRQTDEQTDGQTPRWQLRRAKHSSFARKNYNKYWISLPRFSSSWNVLENEIFG